MKIPVIAVQKLAQQTDAQTYMNQMKCTTIMYHNMANSFKPLSLLM